MATMTKAMAPTAIMLQLPAAIPSHVARLVRSAYGNRLNIVFPLVGVP